MEQADEYLHLIGVGNLEDWGPDGGACTTSRITGRITASYCVVGVTGKRSEVMSDKRVKAQLDRLPKKLKARLGSELKQTRKALNRASSPAERVRLMEKERELKKAIAVQAASASGSNAPRYQTWHRWSKDPDSVKFWRGQP